MANCGTITIEEPFDGSSVQVTSCVGGGTHSPGDTFSVDVEVANPNNVAVTASIEVRINGTVQGSASAAQVPSGGGTVTISNVTAPSTPGDYSISAEVKPGTVYQA